MKKVMLVLIVLVCLAKVSNAQKGSYLLYGNVGFSASSDSLTTKSDSYNFNPGIGYQYNDNWTLGLNIAIGGSRQEVVVGNVPTGNYNTSSSFNIGPFLRYAYPISNIFSIYGQLDLSYLSGKETPYALDEGSYSGFGADFFPALGVNIKNGFALNLSFGGISYQTKSYKGDFYSNTGISNSASQFAVSFGQGATFGISKNFGGSKTK
jgi:hypothetical protein